MRSILTGSVALALIVGVSAGAAAQDYIVVPSQIGAGYVLVPAQTATSYVVVPSRPVIGYVLVPSRPVIGYVLVPDDECDLTDSNAMCSQSSRSNAGRAASEGQ